VLPNQEASQKNEPCLNTTMPLLAPSAQENCQSLWTRPLKPKEQRVGGKCAKRVALEMEICAFHAHDNMPLGTSPTSALTSSKILERIQKISPNSQLVVDRHTGLIVAVTLENQANFSIEPGGQIEYSSAPCSNTQALLEDCKSGLNLLEQASEGQVKFLSHGTNPVAPVDLPLLLPKRRYQILDRYFWSQPHGRGRHMMRLASTVQPNIDIPGGDDCWQEASDLTFALTPFFRHLFSNSTWYCGKRSSFFSERQNIWLNTDPTRTGIPQCVPFNSNVACAYAQWAFKAGVFFIEGLSFDNQPCYGELTFENWLQHGFLGLKPSLHDWENHLNTMFPELRLRGFLEVRCMDAQSLENTLPSVTIVSVMLQNKDLRALLFEELIRLVAPGKSRQDLRNIITLSPTDAMFSNSEFHLKILNLTLQYCVENKYDMEALCVRYFLNSYRNRETFNAKFVSAEEFYAAESSTQLVQKFTDFLKFS
jgi:glutamate--cysteine ligase